MPTRLATIAPDLDALLAAGDRARCVRAALAAARQAAERCGLTDAAPGLTLTEAKLDKIDSLVRALDDEYLSLQQESDLVVTPKPDCVVPFVRARAASAVACALRGGAQKRSTKRLWRPRMLQGLRVW